MYKIILLTIYSTTSACTVPSWSGRCAKKKATVITTLSSDSSVSHTRSTTVDHLPGEQRGNHKVFHDFWWFRDDFFICLSSESHPIHTRRPLIPGEIRGNQRFSMIFLMISRFSFHLSLLWDTKGFTGMLHTIIPYYSPINFLIQRWESINGKQR